MFCPRTVWGRHALTTDVFMILWPHVRPPMRAMMISNCDSIIDAGHDDLEQADSSAQEGVASMAQQGSSGLDDFRHL